MRPDARDVGVAAALAAGFACLYLLTLQGRVFGNDGAFLCEWAALPDRGYEGYHNVLFHRLARALTVAWGSDDPLLPVRALCATTVATGIGLVYLCTRTLAASRGASSFAAAMLGASPAAWFFATTVEVHGLHFAIVSATALVIVSGPWHRPALALALSCAVLPVTYLSHQGAPALGVGWVLLAQCGRLRRGPRFGWPALIGIGFAMLAALLVGQALSNWIRGDGFGLAFGEIASTVASWQRTAPLQVAIHELVAPLAFLLAFAILGHATQRSWQSAASIALFWPTAAFVLYWGIVERGGYVLGPAVALAIAAAPTLDRARPLARRLMLGTLGLQAVLGWSAVTRFEAEGFQIADRVEIVDRLLEGEGWVVSATNLAPAITVWRPDLQEVDLLESFVGVTSAEDWVTNHMPPATLLALVGQRPFVLDRSYTLLDEHWRGVFRESLERLESEIRARFEVEEHPDPSWPVWLARPRR